MNKEETLSNLKAYLDGDTAIGNIIPLRSVLESAIKYLESSLPPDLDEAAEEIAKSEIPAVAGEALDLNGDCYETDDINWPERCGFIRGFKAGAEWMAEQGVSMQITDDTEWEEVDSFIHKNVEGGSIIQIRKK